MLLTFSFPSAERTTHPPRLEQGRAGSARSSQRGSPLMIFETMGFRAPVVSFPSGRGVCLGCALPPGRQPP